MVLLQEMRAPAAPAAPPAARAAGLQALSTEELRAEVARLRALAAARAAEAPPPAAALDDVEEGDEEGGEASDGGCARRGAPAPACPVKSFLRPAARRAAPLTPRAARRPWGAGAPPPLPPGVEEVADSELSYTNGDRYKARERAFRPVGPACPAAPRRRRR
jgi:hypothetical protein